MGTNYYLQRKKPRLVYDEYHIAKRSGGWVPHFQTSDPYHAYDADAPSYHSVEDIRKLLRSGEYVLVDEYEEAWEGEEALAELEGLCAWEGDRAPELGGPYGCYQDPEGYYFENVEFA